MLVNPMADPLQNLKSAEKFYNSKVKELGDNLKELEGIVQSKQMNVRTIEEGTFAQLDYIICTY